MSENVDAEREQDVEQIPEEDGSGDGSGSVSKQETPSRRASSDSNRTTATEHVRLWVLEISTSGLIDTPRTHAVRLRLSKAKAEAQARTVRTKMENI